eukprot:scaffold113540_cov20-Tisochrysis_lutea.AAC.1
MCRGGGWVEGKATAPVLCAPCLVCALKSMHAHVSLPASTQRIQYAKTESDAVSKLKGTFKLDKKKRAEKNAAARVWTDKDPSYAVHATDQMISKGKGGAGAPKAGAAAGGAACSFLHAWPRCASRMKHHKYISYRHPFHVQLVTHLISQRHCTSLPWLACKPQRIGVRIADVLMALGPSLMLHAGANMLFIRIEPV